MEFLAEVTVDVVDVWFDRISKVGIPVAVCTLILWLLWKYGPKIAEGHVETLNTLRETQRSQSNTLKENADALRKIADNSEVLSGLNDKQAKTLEVMCKTDADHMNEHQKTHRCLVLLAEAGALQCDHPEARRKIEEAINSVRRV